MKGESVSFVKSGLAGWNVMSKKRAQLVAIESGGLGWMTTKSGWLLQEMFQHLR